jgi:hypothetical protein
MFQKVYMEGWKLFVSIFILRDPVIRAFYVSPVEIESDLLGSPFLLIILSLQNPYTSKHQLLPRG